MIRSEKRPPFGQYRDMKAERLHSLIEYPLQLLYNLFMRGPRRIVVGNAAFSISRQIKIKRTCSFRLRIASRAEISASGNPQYQHETYRFELNRTLKIPR